VSEPVRALVDHLFRHQAGRLVSILVRHLGGRHLDLAEEVVQDALVSALQTWPFHGVPDRPEAWLMRAARNRAVDALRRDRGFADRVPVLTRALEAEEARANEVDREGELTRQGALAASGTPVFDDEVCMLFMACHPEVPREARLALTLKTVGGFSVPEIARAFLADDRAIAQRIVRAKQRIRTQALGFELPGPDALAARLDSVLDVLYLIFNEGYTAHAGELLVRRDLCETALHLARQVAAHPITGVPKTHALVALMALQAARLPARTAPTRVPGEALELFSLGEQDRSQWDSGLIVLGFRHLELAGQGEEVSAYHLQAGIASCHAMAPSLAETDWPRILWFYDRLAEVQPSPVVLLNRAVALAKVLGVEAAMAALEPLRQDALLRRYHLWHAVLGAFSAEMGEMEQAAAHYRDALACGCSDPERRFLEARLAAVIGAT
jgi:RNA polymerase sigma-70 factor (ECF subfamily)